MSSDQPDGSGAPSDQAAPNTAAPEPGSGSAATGKPEANTGDDRDPAAARKLLGDQSGPENEAYRRGRFRTEGHAAFFTKSKIKKTVIGDQYQIFAGSRSKKTSARLRPNVLARTRATYALVPLYERMLDTVREHRAVVLRGQPGTGMSTTAVHLLDTMAEGRVARLDLTGRIESIRGKDLVKRHGYVIRIPLSDTAVPTGIALDALCELLAEHECYCVLLDTRGTGDQDELAEYAFDYRGPDQQDVLRKHIRWRLRATDADDTEERLVALADHAELREALGEHSRTADIVRLAVLLIQYSRDMFDLDELKQQAQQLVSAQVTEWFGDLRDQRPPGRNKSNDAIGLAAFRIALAVLNESPYDVVVDAAESLERLMVATLHPATEKPRMASPLLDGDSVLTACGARTVPGVLRFGPDARIDCDLVGYEDDRLPIAILSHVWREHHWLRAALSEWLTGLGTDFSPLVWVRAAQAAGLLSSLDFHYGFLHLVQPNMYLGDLQARRFAAIALDQAAENAGTRTAVHAFLRRWRRQGGEVERWTAAATLGYGLGLADIHGTLDQLRILGTPDESLKALDGPSVRYSMADVVSVSLTQLLAFGAVEPVLETLTEWLDHPRTSMRTLARRATRRLIGLRGFHLMYLDITGGREYRSVQAEHTNWPLLLAIQEEDHRLTEPVAELLRGVLRTNEGNDVADRFRSWLRIAERDMEGLMALVRLMPRLVQTADDSARLIHLISVLRRDWAEPLRADVAVELETAVRTAIIREVRPWRTPS
ncbi:MAG TPA: hypothetical protein VHV49_00225 [Pseudonocardiaceae bacterium]|nr:hypothetical protein [Pseudonocardiaceae bacterium]